MEDTSSIHCSASVKRDIGMRLRYISDASHSDDFKHKLHDLPSLASKRIGIDTTIYSADQVNQLPHSGRSMERVRDWPIEIRKLLGEQVDKETYGEGSSLLRSSDRNDAAIDINWPHDNWNNWTTSNKRSHRGENDATICRSSAGNDHAHVPDGVLLDRTKQS